MPFDWPNQQVVLTGGAGFLGRAVTRELLTRGLPSTQLVIPRSRETDLRDPRATRILLERANPTIIIHAAAKSGGLQANRDHPAAFFHDNMAMALSIIDEAHRIRVRTGRLHVLVFIGSMTSYPATAPQPLHEDDLFAGSPDSDVAPYGLAKRTALTMLQAYHREHGLPSSYLIPTNLYGPGDNIDDVRNAHVVGSLIKRFTEAAHTAEIACWGTGAPTRHFLFVEDAAQAIMRAAERLREPVPINIAGDEELSIRELAELIAELTGFRGRVAWDTTKPDGQLRRALDTRRARELLDWGAPTPLYAGLRRTIDALRANR